MTVLVLMLLSLSFSCGSKSDSTTTASGGGGGTSAPKKQIAVIAKSVANVYWEAVHSGAQKAADEEGVEIQWTGPASETEHVQQGNMVDNMVNSKVDGIVIAPTNVDALVRPVESAVARGVPVVLIDSTLHSDKPSSVITTDNYAAGSQAAEALIAAMGTTHKFGGKVIMLRFLEGSGSTEAREKGFADRIAREPGLTLSDQTYTKGAGTTTDAASTADALLRRNMSPDNVLQADGIFGSNQQCATGMLDTIVKFKAQGDTITAPFVGFDSSEELLGGVRDGKIAALVVQDPAKMGYLGVKTMVKLLKGEPVDAKIATATVTVTKANIDDPAIKAVTLQK